MFDITHTFHEKLMVDCIVILEHQECVKEEVLRVYGQRNTKPYSGYCGHRPRYITAHSCKNQTAIITAQYSAEVRDMRNSYRILVGKPEEKR
jgi:hypothetical protein